MATEFDSPRKEALEYFLEAFLGFFFPKIHDEIDWKRGYESLDKELEKICPESETGKRFADKLFRVWRKSGEEAWVLIHGSAKIALIALERSISAWSVLREMLPGEDDNIKGFIAQLASLRRKVEDDYPNARRFVRPGFDTEV